MAGRSLISFASLIILAGGVLLQLLVILSGGVNSNPINQIWFLQASTNGVSPEPRNPSRWTFFAICGVNDSGRNANCGAVVPALPFDPPRNFNTENGLPEDFIGTRHYFYLSRFMFAFYLIALFFAAMALLTGVLALCTRVGAYISGFNTFLAMFFQAVAAALMTAWTIQGRNAFRRNGQDASIGRMAYGITWAAFACFIISTVLFCCAPAANKNEGYTSRRRSGGFFGRKRSTRSRRSNIDIGGRNHIKDDYS